MNAYDSARWAVADLEAKRNAAEKAAGSDLRWRNGIPD